VNGLVERIKSRGHWKVVIRPQTFDRHRLPSGRLELLIRERQVQAHGWCFPHISSLEQIDRGEDFVGQGSEFGGHIEVWRFFTSGQFTMMRAMNHDWTRPYVNSVDSRSGADDKVLPVWAVINLTTEAYEFAARLAVTAAGDRMMSVRVTASGLRGRRLTVGDHRRLEFVEDYQARLDDLPLPRETSAEDLVGKSRDLAIDSALELFSRFGWTPTRQLVSEYQRSLFGDEQ
jgi:hypothetical protein